MAEGIEKTATEAKAPDFTVNAKQYEAPIGPERVTKLSADFLKQVDKTERRLDYSVEHLNKLGKAEEAAELMRLSEKLNDARVHHNDHRTYKIGQQDANSALTKLHEEAAQKAKEAKKQIFKLKWQNRGTKLGNVVKSKYFIVPVAIAGAIGAAGIFATKRTKEERAEKHADMQQNTQALREDIAVLKAAQAAGNGQPTLMGEPLREGDHAARIRAGRTNGAEPVINPSNPPVDLNYQVVR